MSSVQNLRELIRERLNAAAEEIFSEFEKTIVRYEEQIDHQRRLLENIWTPGIKSHSSEPPQRHVSKGLEGLTDQQLSNQERNSSLDQEDPATPRIKEEQEELCTSLDQEDPATPYIKEEQEELCTSLEGEQLVLRLETDAFMVIPRYEKSDHREPESTSSFLFHSSPVAEIPHQEGSKNVGSGSKKRPHSNISHSSNMDATAGSHWNTDTWKKSVTYDVGGKAFKGNSQMQKHLRIHTNEGSFICQICGKSFRLHSGLVSHMRIHTGEKPYSCNTCRKSFRQRNCLLNHMRIHTGEKPYSCKICGRCFSQNSNLIAHNRIHTGEKPYSCKTCRKSFRHSNALLRHVRKSHKL